MFSVSFFESTKEQKAYSAGIGREQGDCKRILSYRTCNNFTLMLLHNWVELSRPCSYKLVIARNNILLTVQDVSASVSTLNATQRSIVVIDDNLRRNESEDFRERRLFDRLDIFNACFEVSLNRMLCGWLQRK